MKHDPIKTECCHHASSAHTEKYCPQDTVSKIEKTVPQLLTPDQYNRLIWHLSEQPDSSMGLRNLIIIMLHITTKKGIYETITY